MTIQLKETHFAHIFDVLGDFAMRQYIGLRDQVKKFKADNNSQPGDFIPVTTNPPELLNIYFMLGQMPEGEVRAINGVMNADLSPQLVGKLIAAFMRLNPGVNFMIDETTPNMTVLISYEYSEEETEANEAKTVIMRIQEREAIYADKNEDRQARGRALIS